MQQAQEVKSFSGRGEENYSPGKVWEGKEKKHDKQQGDRAISSLDRCRVDGSGMARGWNLGLNRELRCLAKILSFCKLLLLVAQPALFLLRSAPSQPDKQPKSWF
jgi:hypothetical protein